MHEVYISGRYFTFTFYSTIDGGGGGDGGGDYDDDDRGDDDLLAPPRLVGNGSIRMKKPIQATLPPS